ncbi:MAG: TrkH family potassium uptake protein [Bacteroides sp.]|jgi:trk system potassium uptake protein TrkH|nr:TrkH family potassium uptake protein [Bacteroides sp.]
MTKVVQYHLVFKVLSRNLFILSGALIVSSALAYYFSEPILPMAVPAALSLLAGLVIHYFTRSLDAQVTLHREDAYLTVTLSWLVISLIGSLPYVISGAIPSFVNAFFESVSGFTTTGSSILTDIEILPRSVVFWRSLTHWIGGIGIIVLVILVMPSLKIGGYHLFILESSLQEKIHPKAKSVGERLLLIYIILTVAEGALLRLGGMNWFESVCHAFGTVATGGFSPKNDSIASYSPYIQYVVMVFMLLAGTNFVVHYYLLKRKFDKIRQNDEFRAYLGVILLVGLVITSILFFKTPRPMEQSIRDGFFQVVSIITCTGFATDDYLLWPQYAWIIIFLAMFLGGSTGSTAGGIKIARHVVVYKNFARIFRQLRFPHAIFHIHLNHQPVSDERNTSILTFVSLYLLVFALGTLSMIAVGLDMSTASGSVATCMAGIGPGIGTVGPASNFAHLPVLGKIILSFLMILGRLEIYTVLILFSRSFWRK